MTRRRLLLLSLGVSVVVLAVAAWVVDPGALGTDLLALHPGLVLLGLAVLGVNYWLRTLRFRMLLADDGKRVQGLFGMVCISATLNYLLPARLGELSYPLLLKRLSGREYSIGAASVLAARVLDLFAVAVLFPFALLASHAALPGWAVRAALLFMVATFAMLAAAWAWLRAHPPGAAELCEPKGAWRGRLGGFLNRVVAHLSMLTQRGQLLPLALVSLGIWLCIALNFFLILAAASIAVPFAAAFTITLVMIPLSLLPAQGFANLGTHEAAWLMVLAAMGLPPEVAARATLLSHLVLVGYVVVMGTLGWCLILFARRRQVDDATGTG